MSNEVTYSSYLSKIKKLKNALENKSWNSEIFFSKLQEIIKIFSKKMFTACADLLVPSLIKNLDESFPAYKDIVTNLYQSIFNTLNFKGKCTKQLKDEFLPLNFNKKKEREPTKREKLFDKIISLYYEYNNYISNKQQKNYYLNTFVQKFVDIKTLYSKMIKEGVDDDKHIYDQFDKDFYDKFILLLDSIEKKICLKEKLINIPKKPEKKNNLELVKEIPLKNRTFFYNKEKLIYGEDKQIEYKNYSFPFTKILKEQIKRQICGFLNSQGGRIFIGISDDKVVNGISMKYHERDIITNEIVNLTYDFYPKCRTYIDVNFIPIKNINDNKYIKNLFIIKIIVSQGETNQLYSCTTKGFNSYLRLQGQCINLTAEEIRYQLIKREKNSDFPINPEEFKDPIPENPELIKSNENLNNQLNIKNIINTNLKDNYNISNSKIHIHEKDVGNGKNFFKIEKTNKRKNEDNYKEYVEEGKEDDYEEENEEEDFEEYNEDDEVEVNEENKKNYSENLKNNSNIFTIKVNINPLSKKKPTRQDVKNIFSSANCNKKFIREGKKFYGYLNFSNKLDAISFQKKFNGNINPNYQIKLTPKY